MTVTGGKSLFRFTSNIFLFQQQLLDQPINVRPRLKYGHDSREAAVPWKTLSRSAALHLFLICRWIRWKHGEIFFQEDETVDVVEYKGRQLRLGTTARCSWTNLRQPRPTSRPASHTDTMRILLSTTLLALVCSIHVYSDGKPYFSAVCWVWERVPLLVSDVNCVSLYLMCFRSSLGRTRSAPGVLSRRLHAQLCG